MNRALVHLAIGALAAVPTLGMTGTAHAADTPEAPTTTTTAPPPGEAEAYALLIDPLLAVGHTSATANGGSGSATANALELGGEPLIPGTTGGTQNGAGSSNGALLDTGVTPLGQLELTPWKATVTSTGSGSTADSDAALLRLFLIDPTILRAAVLQSHSHAESGAEGSSSSSTSDGAVVNAGDGQLEVHVLHAESSSDGKSSSYLVDINGNTIGSSSDADGNCTLEVPDVIALSCLTATGGPAGAATQAGAAVGEATLGSGEAGGTVVGTKSTGQKTVSGGSGTPTTSGGSASGGSTNEAAGDAGLPFTGTDLPPFLAIGAFAVAAGAWLQQASRRLGFRSVR